MPTATTATFDTLDALQLVPSAANATVAAKPPAWDTTARTGPPSSSNTALDC